MGYSSLGYMASSKGKAWTRKVYPGISIRISIRYFELISEQLKEFAKSIEDWTPFFNKWFIPQYTKDLMFNFRSEGGLVGGWEPLSPEYARWKASTVFAGPINVRSTKLRMSLANRYGSSQSIRQTSPRELRFGTLIPYAFYVQKARPVLLRSSELHGPTYTKLIEDFLTQQLEKSGLGRR